MRLVGDVVDMKLYTQGRYYVTIMGWMALSINKVFACHIWSSNRDCFKLVTNFMESATRKVNPLWILSIKFTNNSWEEIQHVMCLSQNKQIRCMFQGTNSHIKS